MASTRLHRTSVVRYSSSAVVVFALVAAAATRVAAAPACVADCARRMAECREAQCASISRKACRDTCRAVTGCAAGGAKIRTFATAVSECRTGSAESTARQRLEIRRGDCPPVPAVSIESTGTIDSSGVCALYGAYRFGPASRIFAALQRIGVTPDGHTVVFEISRDDAPFHLWTFIVPEEGMYRVESDGSAMRRLGPASRYPPFKVFPSPNPPGFSLDSWGDFSFSPDNKFVVFTDRGPGTDGSDAVQLFVMNLESGARTQVTHLLAASQGNRTIQDVGGLFIDDDTILVYAPNDSGSSGSQFTVTKDGTPGRPLPTIAPVPIPGARVVSMFQLASRPHLAFSVALPMAASEPLSGPVTEVFAQSHKNILQLTNFGRSDTRYGVPNRTGRRVLFLASADPRGQNPSQTCQLFSIGSQGDHLRQITRFDAPPPTLAGAGGCLNAGFAPSCQIGLAQSPIFDPVADVLTFDTTCDPFGTNPVGDQLFAVRGDGSGLRQMTNYRGMQVAPDGTVTVELPGPSASPGRDY